MNLECMLAAQLVGNIFAPQVKRVGIKVQEMILKTCSVFLLLVLFGLAFIGLALGKEPRSTKEQFNIPLFELTGYLGFGEAHEEKLRKGEADIEQSMPLRGRKE